MQAEVGYRNFDRSDQLRFWNPFAKDRIEAQTSKFEEYVKDTAENLINKFEDAMNKATEMLNKLKFQAIEKNNETFTKVLRQLEPVRNFIFNKNLSCNNFYLKSFLRNEYHFKHSNFWCQEKHCTNFNKNEN